MGVLIITDTGKDFIARHGLLDLANSFVFLFKAHTLVSVLSDLTTITEADFNGYARIAATWTDNGIVTGDKKEFLLDPALFSKTSGGTSNTVEGWGIISHFTGTDLLIALKLFDAGDKSFVLAGDQVEVSATFDLTAA